jgi:hypothetical protein
MIPALVKAKKRILSKASDALEINSRRNTSRFLSNQKEMISISTIFNSSKHMILT